VEEQEARHRFAEARVAILATVDDRGAPHLVPITFAVEALASPGIPASLDAPGAPAGATPVIVWSATDGKPKRGGRLRRHANIRAHPAVGLLVQHWDERWDALWWVRADGAASVVDDPFAVEHVTRLLRRKYQQYERVPVAGPLIRVEVRAWQGWAASSR
jgi:PPOX class probable F420-dependent enzyme